jgi:predicted nucleic acid-binding protein
MADSLFVLDTNAAIYLLKCEHVPEPFVTAGFAMSIITRMELLSKRDVNSEDEAELRSFMDDLMVVNINEPIENTAIALRRSTKLKLPDCIIAATTIALRAVLLTHDAELLKLDWPGDRTQDIPEEVRTAAEQPPP